MPYRWTTDTQGDAQNLTLWPHQSLPPRGLAAFVLATFTMILLPLFGLLGTVLLWGLLPFLLLAVGSIWFALNKSRRDRTILEELTWGPKDVTLKRQNPKGPDQIWICNKYWARAHLHPDAGPVPNYVTLSGNGRNVEIGAFLSEEERISLYSDLQTHLAQ